MYVRRAYTVEVHVSKKSLSKLLLDFEIIMWFNLKLALFPWTGHQVVLINSSKMQ